MRIIVNGKPREIEEGSSVQDLLLSLQLKPGRVAVERNREIVGRDAWAMVSLQEDDQIEIVHFVGGG